MEDKETYDQLQKDTSIVWLKIGSLASATSSLGSRKIPAEKITGVERTQIVRTKFA